MGCLRLLYPENPVLKIVRSDAVPVLHVVRDIKVLTSEKSEKNARSGYMYGFNGQERVNELNSSSYDFGARMYDSRLGRWFSCDAVFKPSLSSYQFGKNNPNIFIDPDGNDEYYFNYDGTWWVIRTEGVDNFLIQETENGNYRNLDIYESNKSFSGFIKDVFGNDDGDLVSLFMLADDELKNDIQGNIYNKKDKKQMRDLVDNGYLIKASEVITTIADIFTLGEGAAFRNGAKLAIKKSPQVLDEVVIVANKGVQKFESVAKLGKQKYGRYKIIFKDGSEYVGKTTREFKKRMSEHFGKNGNFAGKIDEVQEIVVEELHDVKRKALKFKEQEWLDEARDVAKDTGVNILNKINAVRKRKQ